MQLQACATCAHLLAVHDSTMPCANPGMASTAICRILGQVGTGAQSVLARFKLAASGYPSQLMRRANTWFVRYTLTGLQVPLTYPLAHALQNTVGPDVLVLKGVMKAARPLCLRAQNCSHNVRQTLSGKRGGDVSWRCCRSGRRSTHHRHLSCWCAFLFMRVRACAYSAA